MEIKTETWTRVDESFLLVDFYFWHHPKFIKFIEIKRNTHLASASNLSSLRWFKTKRQHKNSSIRSCREGCLVSSCIYHQGKIQHLFRSLQKVRSTDLLNLPHLVPVYFINIPYITVYPPPLPPPPPPLHHTHSSVHNNFLQLLQ